MNRQVNNLASDESGTPPGNLHLTSCTRTVASPLHASSKRWQLVLMSCLLGLAVWIVFGQTLHHEFVNYDTDIYVYENPDITRGLSLKGIVWAFTHFHVDEWWPLNALSHMLDCELFGLNPAGHHLTNVLLHAASVILLFLLLRHLTGAFWRSAFVAALFAIHPLRVESVAWVTERKDVLSGLFFMLTIGAYVRYVRRPFAVKRYLLVLGMFALGLMSKSMLVTMPFLLLLLDWWPLRRMGTVTRLSDLDLCLLRRLVVEKIPFLLLAVVGALTTMLAVKDLHAIDQLSFSWRIGNALVAYATYIWQMVYPVGLAVFYPHPEKQLPLGTMVGALLVLAAISAAVIAGRRRRPYLLVGWLWFLGMLVPVIGIVQVGIQAHADRYTYLPQIGLYILVTWGVVDLCAAWRYQRVVLGGAAIAVVTGLMWAAHVQTTYWRNSHALWSHTVACTRANPMAHHYLGNVLMSQGKPDEAIEQYQQAIRFKPNYVRALNNLGVALTAQGRSPEAIPLYRRVLARRPHYANARFNLAVALAAHGSVAEAIQHYERVLQLKPGAADVHHHLALALVAQGKLPQAVHHFTCALQIKPDYAEAHHKLASTLAAAGNLPEAIQHYQRALELRPAHARTHYRLGNALAASGNWEAARQQFERALQINPQHADACNNLGNALATLGRLDEAVPYFERTLELDPSIAEAHGNLGAALAAQGRLEEAREHFAAALNLATAQSNPVLASAMLKRIEACQSPASPASATP